VGKGEIRNEIRSWDFIINGCYPLAYILARLSHRRRISEWTVVEVKTNPSSRQKFNHPRPVRRRRI